ncbi:PREDICTED: LOW QUALITY PROTEIN: UPF0728 protein C10orf53 homolog [Phaethon lepturus]|uniref:LOW QUALITY PROTEIN: UPF0728 protein C10orf53 homolog n=1 Tax=Phaethon lepturus TaxID=97097 RepID=UPI00053091C3|nr:PREDICTED: LOW QUALITY PROTEIN: UPF0728 protein C10orf53 homolog [Phaethon lepturus]
MPVSVRKCQPFEVIQLQQNWYFYLPLPLKDRPKYLMYTAVLQADGHQLILEEIPYMWNAVELVVSGETVFHYNINDLDLGGDGKLDLLCEEARKAVLNAYQFTGTHSLLPWFSVRQFTCITNINEHQRKCSRQTNSPV